MKSTGIMFAAALTLSLSANAQTPPEQSMDKPWESLYENPGKTPYDNDQSEHGKLLQDLKVPTGEPDACPKVGINSHSSDPPKPNLASSPPKPTRITTKGCIRSSRGSA